MKKILFLASALLALSCSRGVYDESISYQMKYFSRTSGNCDSLSNNCVSVKAEYPQFRSAVQSGASDSLNNLVRELINSPVFEKKNNSLEELSSYLIDDYAKIKKRFPDSPIVYQLERNVNVILNQAGIVSLEYSEDSFLGGAHPNSIRKFFNINSETGGRILLSELLIKNYKTELNRIAEKKFREARNLKPDEEFDKAGFWFRDNKFELTSNYLITKTGLTFFFNDYEVAPHAVGPTEITIKYGEIGNLINPDGLLNGLQN